MFGFKKPRNEPIEEVAEKLITRMKAQDPSRSYKFNDELDVIKASDGSITSLANFYEEYLRVPEKHRDETLDRFVAAIAPRESHKTLDSARARLLPAFRNLLGLDASRIMAGIERPELLTGSLLPFSNELAVSVVLDSEHRMTMVDESILHDWKCTAQQALDIALENLRKRSPLKFAQPAPGLFVAQYGDDYDATRMLLTDLVRQLPVKGAPIAMVPNRQLLLVTGDQDAPAMSTMIQVAGKALREEPRPLGSELLRLQDDRWQACHPEGPLGTALLNLRLEVRVGDYKAQKDALEHVLRPQNTGIYVADYKLLQKKNGSVVSYGVLTRGVNTMIPKADVMVLVDDPLAQPPRTKIVAWSEFEREAGALLEKLPHTLPRFHVKAHPDPAMIERMAATDLAA